MGEVDLIDILVGIGPIVVLLGVWLFFIGRMKATHDDSAALAKRQADALERIAAALEKRNGGA